MNIESIASTPHRAKGLHAHRVSPSAWSDTGGWRCFGTEDGTHLAPAHALSNACGRWQILGSEPAFFRPPLAAAT